jgi:hypothetical protein
MRNKRELNAHHGHLIRLNGTLGFGQLRMLLLMLMLMLIKVETTFGRCRGYVSVRQFTSVLRRHVPNCQLIANAVIGICWRPV